MNELPQNISKTTANFLSHVSSPNRADQFSGALTGKARVLYLLPAITDERGSSEL
jgi:hypothetical protein